ncbi:acyltransferase [Paenibacillus sp. OV219]|uniref:acyltransferase n=1 Tax=Paenibacillus sp. OV219 TaxID=1884377 RepID=UPI0008D58E88|nr:acyltransferase [Paenibacillus sp. OV219]SEM51948.1 Peptidoglycan/LPS O-acetylase OafA/YrhL, contains acyltransferase and SGNH-hydrolase domains [Paenibacillus sp. OV219]
MKTTTSIAAERSRKERVPELGMLRGMAILGVLMVHATSTAVVEVPNSILRGLYICLNTFSLFCVPAFIFLSGFVLFYHYFNQTFTFSMLQTFYKKRFKQMVIPYLFVSLGYELVEQILNHRSWQAAPMLKLFGEHLLTGKAYPHLYYILITLQLYVLFPLLLLLFRKLRLPVKLAVPLGFAVQWAFYLLNRNYWHIAAKGSWSFTYFAAFLIGAYLGVHSSTFKRWYHANKSDSNAKDVALLWLLPILWVAVTIGFLWMYEAYWTGASTPKGYWFEIGYNLFTVMTTLVLLQACVLLGRCKLTRWLAFVLSKLGMLSFGIYLVHPFFLLVYHRYPLGSAQPVTYFLWTAGSFLFALGASTVVTLLAYRFIPWSWIFLGTSPIDRRREMAPQV